MTTFNLEDLNPGTWFDYEPYVSRVCIRRVTQEDLQNIRKQCIEEIREYKQTRKHGPYHIVKDEKVDEIKLNELLCDHTIVDWEGFRNPDGSEIECTLENKVKLMGKSPDFYSFVDKCVEILDTEAEERAKAVEKNS